jgi:hypothetical protein
MHELKVIMISNVARNLRVMNGIPYWMNGIPFCLLLFGQFSAPVLAQESTDPMEVCYRMSDADQRHACFDQEMQRRHSAAASAAANASHPAARAPDDTVGLDGRQLSIRRKEEGIQPEAVKPVVTALARLRPRPGHLYYFELDNGQVWESTDSEAYLFMGPHETVLIRPGVLGAFFLKTAQGRSIRVHRLR